MKLLLVRHGVTHYNIQNRYTGQSDIELSPPGMYQALAIAQRLASEPLDAIVSSDLQRARATARVIARHHALPVQEDADLREVALGAWEGKTYAEVAERDAARLKNWRRDPEHYAAPGGETIAQVRDRVVRALERWQRRHPDDNVLWVTHGGVIGVLLCHLLGMELRRRDQFRCQNTALTMLELEPGAYARLLCFNETTHLRTLQEESASTVLSPRQQDVL